LSINAPIGPDASATMEAAIKIVLDVSRLVREGKLTAAEAERLKALAARDTGSLAINVLMAFGALAVGCGILALHPRFAFGAVVGGVLVASGIAVSCRLSEQWRLLGAANTIAGGLLLSGGVIGLVDGRFGGFALPRSC
jgi:iron complex transport system permease protein